MLIQKKSDATGATVRIEPSAVLIDAECDIARLEAIEFMADECLLGTYGGEKGREEVRELQRKIAACIEHARRECREERETLERLQTARGRGRYAKERGGAADRLAEAWGLATMRMAEGSCTVAEACKAVADSLRAAKKELDAET